MPSRIRKVFSALSRVLRLQPSNVDLELQDQVVPTFKMGEILEEFPSGGDANGTALATDVGGIQNEGVCQVLLTAGWSVLVAAQETFSLELRQPGGAPRITLLKQGFGGIGGPAIGNETYLIPRVKVLQGETFRFESSALAAGDMLQFSVLIQPL